MMARMLSHLPLPLLPAGAAGIAGLDAAGQTVRQIAAAAGVSTFTARAALGRVRPGGQAPAAGRRGAGQGSVPGQRDGEAAAAEGPLAVPPDPVPRDGERALARWGLPGEGAEPVFAAWCPVPAGRAAAGPARAGGQPVCLRPPARSTAGSATATTGWPPRC